MHRPLSKVSAGWGADCDNSVRARGVCASSLEAAEQSLFLKTPAGYHLWCLQDLRARGLFGVPACLRLRGAQERGDSLTPRAGGRIGKGGRQRSALLPSYLQGES